MKKRDTIAFMPNLRPSKSHLLWQGPDQRTEREWRTATCLEWKGRKKTRTHFRLSAGYSNSPCLASKISITLLWEMSGVFPSSFPLFPSSPLYLFWSYLPLWVVVIGTTVYLLSAGMEAVAFEMLSLFCLNRLGRKRKWQAIGKKKEIQKKVIFDCCLKHVKTNGDRLLYPYQLLKLFSERDMSCVRSNQLNSPLKFAFLSVAGLAWSSLTLRKRLFLWD